MSEGVMGIFHTCCRCILCSVHYEKVDSFLISLCILEIPKALLVEWLCPIL